MSGVIEKETRRTTVSPQTDAMSSYRAEKEGFVSGGRGCSGSDILAVLANLLLTHLLHRALPAHLARRSPLVRLAIESVTLVLPLLAITTVLGDRLWPATVALGLCVLLAWRRRRGTGEEEELAPLGMAKRRSSPPRHAEPVSEQAPLVGPADTPGSSLSHAQPRPHGVLRRRFTESDQVRLSGFPDAQPPSSPGPSLLPPIRFYQPFLTVYRAQLILLTALSILAVDFTIFPRKFAKTESWGISLMDAGVGSFVFSLGIISALPILKRLSVLAPQPLLIELWRSTRKTVPLCLLGLIRIVFVKGVDYPEHVSEYGVHWNFFFTLSILPLTGVLARRFFEASRANLALIGVLIAIVHQCLLSQAGVQEYVMSSTPRTTFVSANREGLASMPGYMVIYVLGLSAGTYVLPPSPDFLARLLRRQTASRKLLIRQPGKALVVYSSWTIIWWTLFFLCDAFVSAPSRRLANPTYCFWIAATNLSWITGHALVHEVLLPHSSKPPASMEEPTNIPLTFEIINRNSLAIFLFANSFKISL
ncbi:hypothetical protein PtA15_5A668 [Puccinia triticina]|uniref:GPI-anchored wall transfer protein n=1 Tax=Puccinia triticina TaxID=208348 RepID=A0ABY7CIP5_9BASI|nr:uncharacterized protein PtA15_5A668 [Puccinia triticina]WAQ85094.1 hypothetical protein PtA15_5A668 [Puccinia triticina]